MRRAARPTKENLGQPTGLTLLFLISHNVVDQQDSVPTEIAGQGSPNSPVAYCMTSPRGPLSKLEVFKKMLEVVLTAGSTVKNRESQTLPITALPLFVFCREPELWNGIFLRECHHCAAHTPDKGVHHRPNQRPPVCPGHRTQSEPGEHFLFRNSPAQALL